MKIKQISASSLATIMLAVPVLGVGTTAFAKTTTTVTPAKEIVFQGAASSAEQGLQDTASNGVASSGGADNLSSNAGTIVQNAKSGGQGIAAAATNTATGLSTLTMGNANAIAGTGTNQTGLDLFGFFNRADMLLTDAATGGISLLLTVLYWVSVLSIILSLLTCAWAIIPGTKTKVWKPLIALASSFAFFGIVSAIAGVDLFNNPVVSLIKWLFTGEYA